MSSTFAPLVPRNLAHPPIQWTAAEVKAWLKFCVEEFSFSPFCTSRFDMNGKAMCLLTRTDFIERAPQAGDVLYNAFQKLRQQEDPHLLSHQQFQSPVILSPAISSTHSTPSMRHAFVPILPQPSHTASSCTTTTATAASNSSSSSSTVCYSNNNSSSISSSSNSSSPRSKGDNKIPGATNVKTISTLSKPPSPCVLVSMLSPAPSERSPSGSDSSCANDRNTTSQETMDFELNALDVTNTGHCAEDSVSSGDGGCRLLWEFIYQLLLDPSYTDLVCWESESDLTFRINNQSGLADLWGQQKNKINMTYEKLSRALRYYYKMNIIRKVAGRRLTYRFLQHPTKIRRGQRGARPHATRVTSDPPPDVANAPGGNNNEPMERVAKSTSSSPTSSLSVPSPASAVSQRNASFSASFCKSLTPITAVSSSTSSTSSLPQLSYSFPASLSSSVSDASDSTVSENNLAQRRVRLSPPMSAWNTSENENLHESLFDTAMEGLSPHDTDTKGQTGMDEDVSFSLLKDSFSYSDNDSHNFLEERRTAGKRPATDEHASSKILKPNPSRLLEPDDEVGQHNGYSGVKSSAANFGQNPDSSSLNQNPDIPDKQERDRELISDPSREDTTLTRCQSVYAELQTARSSVCQATQSSISSARQSLARPSDYLTQPAGAHQQQTNQPRPSSPGATSSNQSHYHAVSATHSSPNTTSYSRSGYSQGNNCQRHLEKNTDEEMLGETTREPEHRHGEELNSQGSHSDSHERHQPEDARPGSLPIKTENSANSEQTSPEPYSNFLSPVQAMQLDVLVSKHSFYNPSEESPAHICNIYPAHQMRRSLSHRNLSPFSAAVLSSSPPVSHQAHVPARTLRPDDFHKYVLSDSDIVYNTSNHHLSSGRLARAASGVCGFDTPEHTIVRERNETDWEQDEPEDLSMKSGHAQNRTCFLTDIKHDIGKLARISVFSSGVE